jgi:ubiquinone/menaquinone biosynthesis C-methylase UbiE
MNNVDENVVAGFGDEWTRYDQSGLSQEEIKEIFDVYFSIFPWENLPKNAVGFDLGCGSGRWAKFVAPRVRMLHCIDPSPKALKVARDNLQKYSNCEFHLASADNMPLPDATADFGYSLGVLHHIPDTKAALKSCTAKLKPGAPLLLYLYYAFDNRTQWFRTIWRLSNIVRQLISRTPYSVRYGFSQFVAFSIYFPLARCALLMDKLGAKVDSFPLSYYRYRSLYVMRNDALDRFGTRLEQRFTREEIQRMMEEAGLENIEFRKAAPYWCAVGNKVCVE